MMIKSREIEWNEFIKLQVVDNCFEHGALCVAKTSCINIKQNAGVTGAQ